MSYDAWAKGVNRIIARLAKIQCSPLVPRERLLQVSWQTETVPIRALVHSMLVFARFCSPTYSCMFVHNRAIIQHN